MENGETRITLNVRPFTGSVFQIDADISDSFETLKKTIARNAKLSSNRFQLVYNDRLVFYFLIQFKKQRRLQLYKKMELKKVDNKVFYSTSVRILQSGSVAENRLIDGCSVSLVPNVQSGLVSSKKEASTQVTQALESLSDQQVRALSTDTEKLLAVGGKWLRRMNVRRGVQRNFALAPSRFSFLRNCVM